VGQAHGCPYRTFSPENLSTSLQSIGVTNQSSLREIQDLVHKKHYHVACTKVWELTHPQVQGGLVESITSPNMYFERSYNAAQENVDKSVVTS